MSSDKKGTLNRRDFFRKGIKSATEASDRRSLELSRLWFRPPFAIDELSFLDQCSRCGDCLRVCLTGVIIPLPEKYGSRASGTPVMDLLNKACSLCEDWPCVQVCKPRALRTPIAADDSADSNQDIPLRPMATAAVDVAACIPYLGPECGACADSCPVEGALKWAGDKPTIDVKYCVGCGLCRQACVTDPKSIRILPFRVDT